MKKMLLAAIVFFMAQISMAALGMPKEKLEARVKPYAERIEKAKLEKAGDFTKDAAVMKLISDSLIKIISSSGSTAKIESLIKLLNIDSGRSVLMEIGRLSSVISDKNATASDISSARKALELLSLSANSVELLSKNEAHRLEQQAKVDLAIKISEKIAKFNDYTSETAKKYAKAYETALENNEVFIDPVTKEKFTGPRAAMKKASQESKKEVTEKDLECEA